MAVALLVRFAEPSESSCGDHNGDCVWLTRIGKLPLDSSTMPATLRENDWVIGCRGTERGVAET
jgi:hypothetical protein